MNRYEEFAQNLYSENLRGFYELEAMRYGIMARVGLTEKDALELAVKIVAIDDETITPQNNKGAKQN